MINRVLICQRRSHFQKQQDSDRTIQKQQDSDRKEKITS
jgi:hypothetical protein